MDPVPRSHARVLRIESSLLQFIHLEPAKAQPLAVQTRPVFLRGAMNPGEIIVGLMDKAKDVAMFGERCAVGHHGTRVAADQPMRWRGPSEQLGRRALGGRAVPRRGRASVSLTYNAVGQAQLLGVQLRSEELERVQGSDPGDASRCGGSGVVQKRRRRRRQRCWPSDDGRAPPVVPRCIATEQRPLELRV